MARRIARRRGRAPRKVRGRRVTRKRMMRRRRAMETDTVPRPPRRGTKRGRSASAVGRNVRPRQLFAAKGASKEAKFVESSFGSHKAQPMSLIKLAVPKRVLRFGGAVRTDEVTAPTVEGVQGTFPGYDNVTSAIPLSYGLPGWFYMRYQNVRDTVNQTATYPCYFINLTRTPNTGSTACMFSMKLGGGGQPVFSPAIGTDMDDVNGVLTSQLSVESATDTFESLAAARTHYIPRWYDVRLQMFGAKSCQTTFVCDYVQINEDHCDPDYDGVNPANGADLVTDRLNRERQMWYQNFCRAMVGNKGLSDSFRQPSVIGWNVLKRWTYNVAPNEDTSEDTTANSVTAKLFIRDGRVLDYRRIAPTAVPDPNDFIDEPIDRVPWTRPSAGGYDYLDDPMRPKEKRWLIVYALHSLKVDPPTDANTPSFNVLYRKAEYAAEP